MSAIVAPRTYLLFSTRVYLCNIYLSLWIIISVMEGNTCLSHCSFPENLMQCLAPHRNTINVCGRMKEGKQEGGIQYGTWQGSQHFLKSCLMNGVSHISCFSQPYFVGQNKCILVLQEKSQGKCMNINENHINIIILAKTLSSAHYMLATLACINLCNHHSNAVEEFPLERWGN